MREQSWDARSSSFGEGVDAYDASRPGYTADTVRWIAGEQQLRVIDLGAGTGRLTRQLVSCGHFVTAVEPDPVMRSKLFETEPSAVTLRGCAEAIPVSDSSHDALLIAQAYHWFDPDPAHREFARVVKPGGILAALWNLREEVGWSAELTKILQDEDTGTDPRTAAGIMLHGALAALRSPNRTGLVGWLATPSFGSSFGPIIQRFFPNVVRYTKQMLVDLVRSRSYYLTSTPERQVELENQVRELVDTHPDLSGHEEFDMRFVTVVFRAERLPRKADRLPQRSPTGPEGKGS